MKPNTSTWPRGVRGTSRMMVKGMKVSRSRAVRLRADTSRGFRVPPSAALEKSPVAVLRSEPSSLTPLVRNSTPCRTLSSDSFTCSCSLVRLKPWPPNTIWSGTPTLFLMSGISMARVASMSSTAGGMLSAALRSARVAASMASCSSSWEKSAASSSSSLVEASRLSRASWPVPMSLPVTSRASSSRMRYTNSISSCSVRTASCLLSPSTSASSPLSSIAICTRPGRPALRSLFSRALLASCSWRSRLSSSRLSMLTTSSPSLRVEVGVGRPMLSRAVCLPEVPPPFRRVHRPCR
mmetsp:Transcript_7250/g.15818  ORF Transcript_7250/g.15818 Transcript_7250/m.15818 type:complete len:295 (+) Transcript_7250:2142-3026(+)